MKPRSSGEIRSALSGIAEQPASSTSPLEDGNRMLACSFQSRDSANGLAAELRAGEITCDVRRGRGKKFEVLIDVGDRAKAGDIVDLYRSKHGDPPPAARRRHDWLIFGSVSGATLGLIATVDLGTLKTAMGVFSMTIVGCVCGFSVDHLSFAFRRGEGRRFGIMELCLVTALIGMLLMLSKQIPFWLSIYE